ncbi:unnamed protein product [Bemisia tabaci]|uniref:MRG-binding protein n=1 Tax=Bemisia tabaci TaxID=7038 RepID=A0A9P0F755_BEMTA|nr:unnamed protein product [Bemisia tabaci]
MSDSEGSEFTWTPAYEVQLMFAMIGLKPVGINQHFHMARIQEKFSAAINRTVEPETIWKHLNTWYDMEKLDEMEPFPFPCEEEEFELPDDEFGELKEQVKKNGSRLERVENLRKPDEIKKEYVREEDTKDNTKEEDGGNKNKNKSDKKAPFRRVSKSDKNDSSGAEESKEKDEDKGSSGGRTRRSIKVEEPNKDDSNDSTKRNDLNSAKKPGNKKEVVSDVAKKKSGSDSVDLNKSDANLKRPASRTPVKTSKEPEKTPQKRVTRASFTPSEIESAKKKRKR